MPNVAGKKFPYTAKGKAAAKKAVAKKAKKPVNIQKGYSLNPGREENYYTTDGGKTGVLRYSVRSNTNAKGYVPGGKQGQSKMLSDAKKKAKSKK